MVVRSLKPCAYVACQVLVRGDSHCPRHAPLAAEQRQQHLKRVHARYNQRRDESDGFYKSVRWKRLSAYYRKRHPLCECCEDAASAITDHIKPYKTNPELGLDWDNLRALCRPCHNRIGERVGLLDSREALNKG